jgi:hypothetical protein
MIGAAWLAELADKRRWPSRLEATRARFETARAEWARGNMVPLYDPRDTVAWYVFQANAYANDRMNWIPEEAVRIVPTLTRLGREIETLLRIPGAEARAARLMNAERAQPDAGLFELVVGLAYQRAGWNAEFVPEQRGQSKTPDLLAQKGKRRWAVECKRMDRSSYQAKEKARGDALSRPVHDLALQAGRSISMTVVFDSELVELPDDYLERRAAAFQDDPTRNRWADEGGMGIIREIDWRLARKVLDVDDVYFGSTRMIELLLGRYDHDLAHNMAGRWRPARERPFWAEALYQASVVSWKNKSFEATRKKARHFRSIVADAARQLPADRPGVVHVGVESWSGGDVDAARHIFNRLEMLDFDPGESRLRWVYGEYVAPEVTTRSNESWAIEETSASYRVGRHSTPEPLPDHMLLTPEQGIMHGVHWDPETQRPMARQPG